MIIRKAKKGDGSESVKLWNEGIRRKFFVYNGGNELRKKKDSKKLDERFASQNKSNFTMVCIDESSKHIIGSCLVHGEKGRSRHRVELGWFVHPDHAGKGIATKLVKATLKELKKNGIKRVEAEAALENKASIKLAKKAGFKIEGKRKKGLLLDDGRYVDTYLFGKTFD